ncbi:uncharacterized protein [Drosophila kikkawai]|uniref:Uncharacterized protein n=1 Tax=Drosophila kikkawai TaxID=30033 RepID=A0ABM4GB73_DROKI
MSGNNDNPKVAAISSARNNRRYNRLYGGSANPVSFRPSTETAAVGSFGGQPGSANPVSFRPSTETAPVGSIQYNPIGIMSGNNDNPKVAAISSARNNRRYNRLYGGSANPVSFRPSTETAAVGSFGGQPGSANPVSFRPSTETAPVGSIQYNPIGIMSGNNDNPKVAAISSARNNRRYNRLYGGSANPVSFRPSTETAAVGSFGGQPGSANPVSFRPSTETAPVGSIQYNPIGIMSGNNDNPKAAAISSAHNNRHL